MGKKITMFSTESSSIQERFEQYLSAASAKGLSSKTLKTYRQHFHCISKHLDITVPLSSLSRAQVDAAIVSMRNSGLSANSISSYLRAFNSFLTWCRENGYSGLTVPNYKPKETVKEARTFTVPLSLYQFIRCYCLDHNIAPEARIFPITERAVQKRLQSVCSYLGYSEDISTHSFRKFYATEIYNDNGYNIVLVQQLLQHSSAAVTQRYIGIQQQELEKAIEGHLMLEV